jgi:hypothetical protein
MKRAIVLGGLMAALAGAQSASAQVTVGWDAAGFSSYDWRGLRLSSKPVIQPDLYFTFPIGGASLTAGGWANVELGKYDPPAIGEGGGVASPDLTEFDWWGEIGYTVGKATLVGGATGYIYPNDFGLTKDNNTIEVYGKLSLDAPLSPKISAYYDVDKIKGLYLEGSISHGVPLGATTLTLGALAGLNAGQGCEPSAGACTISGYNFYDNGLTHVDLSAAVDFSAGPVSIAPAFHFVINSDDFTKIRNFNKTNEDFKVWGGVTISWSKEFGAKEEAKE